MSRDFDRHLLVWVWRADGLADGDMTLTMEADNRELNNTSGNE